MAHTFTLRHRVEFSETDMAGIIHYSSYFRYMEVTEHAFLRSLGFSVVGMPGVGWPRVDVGCVYKSPLRFEDEVDVTLTVEEIRSRSIRYGFRFVRVAPGEPVVVASGHTTTVCVAHDPATGQMKATAIPVDFAACLEEAPKP